MAGIAVRAIKALKDREKQEKKAKGEEAKDKLYTGAGKSRAGTKERAKLYGTGSAGEAARKKLYSGRKAGGSVKRKRGGTAKKHAGGGFDAKLHESLGARHPGTKGNLAARAAMSKGEEEALGRRPYAAVRTMDRTAKKGGSVRRKKGSTVSRRGGGKIMVGYKAGGKV